MGPNNNSPLHFPEPADHFASLSEHETLLCEVMKNVYLVSAAAGCSDAAIADEFKVSNVKIKLTEVKKSVGGRERVGLGTNIHGCLVKT